MTFPHQNQLAWKVSMTIMYCISLSMTMMRITHRWQTARLWWDDYVLAIPWSIDLVSTIIIWTGYGKRDISWKKPDPEGFIYSAWFDVFRYFTAIWFCHISLTLSVARIFLPGHRYRLWALFFVVVFFLSYLTNVFIGTFLCPGSPWWKTNFDQCVLPLLSNKAASTLIVAISDMAADIILVTAPFFMFWKIKFSNPSDRILILGLFASSVITIIALGLYCAVWYAAALIGPDSKLLFKMMGHLHASLALLVTNLQILVMIVYRKLRHRFNRDPENRRSIRVPPPNNGAGTLTLERPSRMEDSTSVPSYTVLSVPSSIPSSDSEATPTSTNTTSGNSSPASPDEYTDSSQLSDFTDPLSKPAHGLY